MEEKKIHIIYRDNEEYQSCMPQVVSRLQNDGYNVDHKAFPKGTTSSEIKNELQKTTLEGFLITDTTTKKALAGVASTDGELDTFRESRKLQAHQIIYMAEDYVDSMIRSDDYVERNSAFSVAGQRTLQNLGERYMEPLRAVIEENDFEQAYIVMDALGDYTPEIKKAIRVLADDLKYVDERRAQICRDNGIEPYYPDTYEAWVESCVKEAGFKGKVDIVENVSEIPTNKVDPKKTLVVAHHHTVYYNKGSTDTQTANIANLLGEDFFDWGCPERSAEQYTGRNFDADKTDVFYQGITKMLKQD